MYEYQNHLTEPPIPVGGYLPKTISDEELKKFIKDRADMCMAILNGDEKEYEGCDIGRQRMSDHDECIKAVRKFHEDVIKGYLEKPNQKLDESIRHLTDDKFFLLSMLVMEDAENES